MTAFLTGGTGFVGAHIARALLQEGETVRCLVRPTSRRDNLSQLPVTLVEGDLCDLASLTRGIRGCSVVYHCAADYRLFAREPAELYRNNVEGTEKLLVAAAECGVERVVYTSSVGTLGLLPDGPADEETPVGLERMVGHYKRSKFLAEQVALRASAQGQPVVIVNPSTPVGDLDIKPTPTGQIVVDFLSRRIPAYVDTGLNLIDVRDVAAGHLAAAQHGRVGEKYILGHRNLTLKEILDLLAQITGLRAPSLRVPHWLPWLAAAVDTSVARLRRRVPRVPLESVRMSRYRMFFDSSKAMRELRLPQSPVEGALHRAVVWFKEQGYVSP